jgi:O-antigen/teichoic acid export membrane protein
VRGDEPTTSSLIVDESEATTLIVEESEAILGAGSAGGKVIRGGLLRAGGYAVGTVAATAASIVLLRYLGPVAVGRYVTVMSLLAIVGGLTDAGLTVIGQREYAIAETDEERRRLLAYIVAMRIAITPLGVIAATAFALVAGYDRTLVLGTLIGGVGLVVANVAVTLTVPLSVQLRLGAVTATEVVKQLVTAAGMALLAVAGAGLLAFFAVNVAAGAASLALAIPLAGAAGRVWPRFAVRRWLPLLRESAPVALALAVNVLYVRALVILMSLLASPLETGYFATSYRVLEVFVFVPLLMLGSAFPVLAHAGHADEARLAYALQRLAEVTLLTAVAIVLVLVIAAQPVLDVLGGSQYDQAADVLRIQAFALLGAFLTQVWVTGLVSIRRQRALIVTNCIALATALVLGGALIPSLDAEGAAISAVVGELVLATITAAMLVRARPALRPPIGGLARVLAAGGAGAAAGLLLPIGDVAGAVVAVVVYAAAAFALRAVPLELLHALRGGREGPDAAG